MKYSAIISIAIFSFFLSCKKDSSGSQFLQVKVNNQSILFDSLYSYIDSTYPDDFEVYIYGVEKATGNSIQITCYADKSHKVTTTYNYIVDPLAITANFTELDLWLKNGNYPGHFGIGGSGSSYLTVSNTDHNILQGNFYSTLNPPINPGAGGYVDNLQLTGQFKLPFILRP